MSKSGSWFKGLFWGGIISSALVLLYTPFSGEDLQAKAKDYLENVKTEMQEAGDEKRREMEEQLAFLRSGK
ncbi:MAG: YtxH domain-containing protein [Anaerolineaceae bacterium]|nr:YtxH domain-containing protein [Anaerolineaceae bacterium]